ncbi:MAG TPA: SDR family oxidoreductase, partial [Myxococcales bacterium]
AGTGYIGYGAACGAVESMSRLLAAELGPSGIRVICLLPHAIPEATAMGSHSRDVFRPFAERAGITVEQMLARHADTTLLKRLPTLAQVANVAAFVASDQAGAMTGTVVNLTCGTLVD